MKKSTVRIIGVTIVLVLGLRSYFAFTQPSPGEWESDGLIEFANEGSFANTVLEGEPETVVMLGVKWKRQRAKATFADHEGVLYLDQNADAGIALQVFLGGALKVALTRTRKEYRCGGKGDFIDYLGKYLKVTIEGFRVQTSESEVKRQMKEICGLFEKGKTQDFGVPCNTMFKEMTEVMDKACEDL